MKKRFFAFALISAVMLVMLSGCANDGLNTVRGRGDMVSHDISVGEFSGLDISGGFLIEFSQSNQVSVTLVIQENLFEHVETGVRSGVLRIGHNRNFNTTSENTPRLYVQAPNLNSLDVSGAVSGTIDLNTEALYIDISGAANLTLTGSAVLLNITAAGAANINAFDMIATDVSVDMSGAGSVEVYASGTLNARVSGVGSVRYDGNPEEVIRSISGLGTIESRN